MITRRQLSMVGLAGLALPSASVAAAAGARAPALVTHTYVRSFEGKRAQLGKFLELNWVALYREAVKQGIATHAVLYAIDPPIKEGDYEIDYMFEVGYPVVEGYAERTAKIQPLAETRKTVLVEGEDLRGLGKVIDERSFLVRATA
jgi:hypothetical protein